MGGTLLTLTSSFKFSRATAVPERTRDGRARQSGRERRRRVLYRASQARDGWERWHRGAPVSGPFRLRERGREVSHSVPKGNRRAAIEEQLH